MTNSLEHKVALVTGGGSGIGRASALAFAREGAKVVVSDVDVKSGQETVNIIKKDGGESFFIKTDVSIAQEVKKMVETVVEKYGRLDCAHNNAGISEVHQQLTADCTEEDWDRVISINLKGVWLCMKYEIPQMLGQGSGSIVNTASTIGLIGTERRTAYCASKHGIIGLTKVAAIEYATHGIRVNAVCPGITMTPLLKRTFIEKPEREEKILARHPMGRAASPEEIAEAVVWLCSPAASYITGHPLVIDGGRLAL